jgi:hypothetical protein
LVPAGQIIWKLRIFQRFVDKIQVPLKSDNYGYYTWKPIYIYVNFLMNFFVEWEVFQIKVVEKVKTHFDVEKYGRAKQATHNSIIQHTCFTYPVTKATNTHTQNIKYLLLFHSNSDFASMSQCFIMHILLLMLFFKNSPSLQFWCLSL